MADASYAWLFAVVAALCRLRRSPLIANATQTPPPSETPSGEGNLGTTGPLAPLTRPRLVELFPALRHSAFRWFAVGNALSTMGFWMQDAGLRWYVQLQTAQVGSDYWLGLIGTASTLPMAVFSIVAGMLADRYPKRWILIVLQSMAMLMAFALAALVSEWAVSFSVVFLFAIFAGIVRAFEMPTRQAFVVEMVGKDDLISAIALNSAIIRGGRVLGAAAAGTTIVLAGVASSFLLNGIAIFTLVLALVMMKVSYPAAPAKKSTLANDVQVGFRTIAANKDLLYLVVGLFFVQMTAGPYLTLLPALAHQFHQSGAHGYGMLLTAAGAGAFLASVIVGRVNRVSARRPLVIRGMVLQGVGLTLIPVWPSLWTSIVCLFAVGMGWVLFLASANSTIQLSVDDSVRGRVMSVCLTAFGLAAPLGCYLAGVTAVYIGTAHTFMAQGLLCLVVLALLFPVLNRPASSPTEESQSSR